jgi:hypothetical protein
LFWLVVLSDPASARRGCHADDPELRALPDTQRLARRIGEYFVLLNNDVVVTDGWLDQLITLANAKSGREENVTAENAESRSETEGGWRPAVDSGAGS